MKTAIQSSTLACLFLAVGLAITGCNVGMAPKGPDEAEVKAKEAALPPQQQIAMLRSSPMPGPEKQKRIADIEQKYNIKADSPSTTPGTR